MLLQTRESRTRCCCCRGEERRKYKSILFFGIRKVLKNEADLLVNPVRSNGQTTFKKFSTLNHFGLIIFSVKVLAANIAIYFSQVSSKVNKNCTKMSTEF